jgi:cysteinyl-tRNA synthetase
MSKSLGNFITVRQLLEEGYDPASIRHQLISSHYRSDLNFTRAGLDASRRAVQRLLDFETRVRGAQVSDGATPSDLPRLADELLSGFRTAMDNDFNSADALAALFTFVSRVNSTLDGRDAVLPPERAAVGDAFASVDRVFGLIELARAARSVDDDLAKWVEERIRARADARGRRDFAAADGIRAELADKGIVLEDGPAGTRWKVAG